MLLMSTPVVYLLKQLVIVMSEKLSRQPLGHSISQSASTSNHSEPRARRLSTHLESTKHILPRMVCSIMVVCRFEIRCHAYLEEISRCRRPQAIGPLKVQRHME